jgi:uncharacterized protein (DUF697 family)
MAAAAKQVETQDASETTQDTPPTSFERQAADKIVKSSMKWTAAAAIVPIPYVDLVALGAVQARMVQELANVYGVDADKEKVKSLITALLGTLTPAVATSTVMGFMGSAFKAVPGIGTIIGGVGLAGFGAAATYAIGQVFINHFESDGDLLGFSVDDLKERLKKEFDAAKVGAE